MNQVKHDDPHPALSLIKGEGNYGKEGICPPSSRVSTVPHPEYKFPGQITTKNEENHGG